MAFAFLIMAATATSMAFLAILADPQRRKAACLIGASVGVTFALAIVNIVALPYSIWNNAKLAPPIGLWYGIPLYPGPREPITDWVQGPVGALIFAAAVVGGSADGMLYVAGVINLAFVLIPMVVLVRTESADIPAVAAAIAALLAGLLSVQSMFGTAFVIVLDSLALGFLLLAVVALRRAPPASKAILAGGLLALAIWTKHTLVAGCIGVIAVEGFGRGQRPATVLAGWMIVFTLLLLAAFSAAFGPDRLWHWMLDVPGRHAWVELASRKPRTVVQVVREVAWHLSPAAACLAVAVAASRGQGIAIPPLATGFGIIAAFQLPASVAGYLKIGGSYNHLGIVACLLALSAAIVLVRLLDGKAWPAASVAITAAAWSLIAGPSFSRCNDILGLTEHTPTDGAVEFARAHPRQAYFPWHPLATLVAEGRLDHLEYGLLDLSFAGKKPDRELLLAGLPDRLEYVVYPDPPFSNYVFNLLGGNLVPSSTESLPGFRVYSLNETIRGQR